MADEMTYVDLDEFFRKEHVHRGMSMREYHDMMRREVEGRITVPDELLGEENDHDPLWKERDELLEILLCPECDLELRSDPCSPVHALLQDNPMQHRLLLPFMEKVVLEIRHDETKICTICPGKVPIAQGDCTHVVDRYGQVWMSKQSWEKLVQEVNESRTKYAKLEDLHNDYVDNMGELRRREEDEKRAWAAEWAAEKLDRLCEDAEFAGYAPSHRFYEELRQMLDEDK